MKIILSTLALFLCVSLGAQSGMPQGMENSKNTIRRLDSGNGNILPEERTTVRWVPDTLFFGEIYEGAILLDSFRVTNTGEHPYMIREVKASCDCTVLRFPDRPVMPGETATIRLEFDSAGKAGHTQPGIIVYDNSKPNSRNILYLDGTVLPRKKPRSMLDGQ
ncbi:MAG: DUF1573 domain-containing protein [Saprospiraceae bacterium]|nr:DUF1573 domain-containing protein [Saprospiraceae bacterium]MCB0573199.1 DUF1573 domain-containing protein [Saprospiraceae bacterium]MCB9307996.1 DUF1573 domain-containing protein [Lewinellaceae bacterium]